jgi:para-nitrobenzyl esterase
VKIQSMADSTFTPSDPSRYTITFGADGRASLRVDCNRGSATWTSEASGHLVFGPASMTKVMCPPESLYNRVVRDLPYVRSYILRGGKLHLATMADGAIYELEPIPPTRD